VRHELEFDRCKPPQKVEAALRLSDEVVNAETHQADNQTRLLELNCHKAWALVSRITMDPLSLIGGIQACSTIVTGCIYSVQKLAELRKRYKQADNTIRLMANELMAVRAAMGQIEGWYKFEVEPKVASLDYYQKLEDGEVDTPPEEMVEAFKVTFEGCRESLEALKEDLDELTSKNPFLKRVGVIWNEPAMREHAQMLRHQVGLLQLLTTTLKLYVLLYHLWARLT
jgi:hypothetical protein